MSYREGSEYSNVSLTGSLAHYGATMVLADRYLNDYCSTSEDLPTTYYEVLAASET